MAVIETPHAPEALGPYSQGRVMDDLLFTAGQIGLDPKTMKMAEGPEAQIKQVFNNILAIVRAAGGEATTVQQLTVYLTDLGDWPLVNAAMEEMFTQPFPARTAVGVQSLPFGAVVEVSAIAAVRR